MKKLLGIVVLGLLWCNVGFAEKFIWSCLDKGKFQIIIKIDTFKKEIEHISSYDFDTKIKHNVNEYYKIVDWDSKKGVWASIVYSQDYANLSFFDFKNNKIYLSGISLEPALGASYSNLEYDCFKSNN